MDMIAVNTSALPKITARISYNGQKPEVIDNVLVIGPHGVPQIKIPINRSVSTGDVITFDTTLEYSND